MLAISMLALAGCQITLADETAKYDGGGCTACGADECVDTRSDPQHCGGCDVACGAGVCVDGTCTSGSCALGATDCSTGIRETVCAHLGSSMEHCGDCQSYCDERTFAMPVCAAGVCRGGEQGEPFFAAGDALQDGVLRIYDGEVSQPLCFAGFDAIAGEIVCRFFGLTYGSHTASPRTGAEGLGGLSCMGGETVLTDCAYTVGPCATDEMLRLTCALP